jgi:antitoxin component YwqK of YwqJK toxin-antitoxin module
MRVDEKETYVGDDLRVMHGDEPFTGEVAAMGPEGNIVELATYFDGVPHGPQIIWYSNGQKKQEGVCDYGRNVGEWRRWHKNGQLAECTVFDDHNLPASRKRWDDQGNLTEEGP